MARFAASCARGLVTVVLAACGAGDGAPDAPAVDAPAVDAPVIDAAALDAAALDAAVDAVPDAAIDAVPIDAGLCWRIETVPVTGAAGSYSALALDAAGHEHIAFYRAATTEVMYATNASGSWVVAPIATAVVSGYSSHMVALALTPAGVAHVTFPDTTAPRGLRHASNEGGVWAVDTIDANGRQGSVAVDAAGVHVVYFDTVAASARYAHLASTTWTTELIEDNGYTGVNPTVAIGPGGVLHASFVTTDNSELRHATRGATGWTRERIATASFGSDMAIDAQGRIEVAYRDQFFDLRVASKVGSIWTGVTVDNAMIEDPALAIDATGRVHVAYKTELFDLAYARRVGAVWTHELVDEPGGVGDNPSIAIDAAGRPHISYYDATNTALKLAVRTCL